MPIRPPPSPLAASQSGFGRDQLYGYAGRTVIFLGLAAAVTCSGILLTSCKFVSFHTESVRPWPHLIPPFMSSLSADVGLFSYRITNSTDRADETSACQPFQSGKFISFNEGNIDSGTFDNTGYWITAQFASAFALAFGLLGLVVVIWETCFMNCIGGNIFGSIVLIIATVSQGLTFLFTVDSNFCFNAGPQTCHLGPGGICSIASTVLYFLAAVGMFSLPRPDPVFPKIFRARGQRLRDDIDESDDDENPTTTKKRRQRKSEVNLLPSLPEETIHTAPSQTSYGEGSRTTEDDTFMNEFTDEYSASSFSPTGGSSHSRRSLQSRTGSAHSLTSGGSAHSRKSGGSAHSRKSGGSGGSAHSRTVGSAHSRRSLSRHSRTVGSAHSRKGRSSAHSRVSILNGDDSTVGIFEDTDDDQDHDIMETGQPPIEMTQIQETEEYKDNSFSVIANRTSNAAKNDSFSVIANRTTSDAKEDSFSVITNRSPGGAVDDSFSEIASRHTRTNDDSFAAITTRSRRSTDDSFSDIASRHADESFSAIMNRKTGVQDDSFSAIASRHSRAGGNDSFSDIANRRSREVSFADMANQQSLDDV